MKYNPKIVLAFWRDQRIPPPSIEHIFLDTRKWRFDFAWPQHKVALEVEGGIWIAGRHNRGAGFAADMEKYNNAAMHGWRVLRVVPKDLCLVNTAALIRLTLGVRELAANGGHHD